MVASGFCSCELAGGFCGFALSCASARVSVEDATKQTAMTHETIMTHIFLVMVSAFPIVLRSSLARILQPGRPRNAEGEKRSFSGYLNSETALRSIGLARATP